MSRHANEIVETMPENELSAFNSFKYHRSSTSYHLGFLCIKIKSLLNHSEVFVSLLI